MRDTPAIRCVASASFPASPPTLLLRSLSALAAALSGLVIPAHAQVYTCQTREGKTMSSDRPIPECSNVQMIERQRSGVTRVIPAPLTEEQRRQKEAQQLQKKLAEFAAREQQRKDNALLASYSSVAEIEAARQRVVGDSQQVLVLIDKQIAGLLKDREPIAHEIQKYKGQPVPPALKRQIERIDTALMLEEKNRAAGQANIDRINQKYDAEKRRFIELTKPPS